jgi:glycerophosphoryl diester phosphodiesterase
MKRAHSAGKRAVFWTLNSREEMAACLAIGADGFFTDDVHMAREALRAARLLPSDLELVL